MSEEVNNPTAVEVESAGTDIETTSETVETTEGTSELKSYQGRDRVGEALNKAKAEAIPEEMSLETLTEVEGLDEGGHKGINYNKVVDFFAHVSQSRRRIIYGSHESITI